MATCMVTVWRCEWRYGSSVHTGPINQSWAAAAVDRRRVIVLAEWVGASFRIPRLELAYRRTEQSCPTRREPEMTDKRIPYCCEARSP